MPRPFPNSKTISSFSGYYSKHFNIISAPLCRTPGPRNLFTMHSKNRRTYLKPLQIIVLHQAQFPLRQCVRMCVCTLPVPSLNFSNECNHLHSISIHSLPRGECLVLYQQSKSKRNERRQKKITHISFPSFSLAQLSCCN